MLRVSDLPPFEARPSSAGAVLYTELAARLTRPPLDGILREYPHLRGVLFTGRHDLVLPRESTPVFFGCFDWHSAVHNHWTLVRWLRERQGPDIEEPARGLLDRQFRPEKIAAEVAFLTAPHRAGFSCPYGLAWFLQLAAELQEWGDRQGLAWLATLEPLESLISRRLLDWVSRLAYAVRTGTHEQTAFSFALILDWARARQGQELEAAVCSRALEFFRDDAGYPLRFEPSGGDFLSPGLCEADLMRRVLPAARFAPWLRDFLPQLASDEIVLAAPTTRDAADGQLSHLSGLAASRASALDGIYEALEPQDSLRPTLKRLRDAEGSLALDALGDPMLLDAERFATTAHWVGTLMTYFVTRRAVSGCRG